MISIKAEGNKTIVELDGCRLVIFDLPERITLGEIDREVKEMERKGLMCAVDIASRKVVCGRCTG